MRNVQQSFQNQSQAHFRTAVTLTVQQPHRGEETLFTHLPVSRGVRCKVSVITSGDSSQDSSSSINVQLPPESVLLFLAQASDVIPQ